MIRSKALGKRERILQQRTLKLRLRECIVKVIRMEHHA